MLQKPSSALERQWLEISFVVPFPATIFQQLEPNLIDLEDEAAPAAENTIALHQNLASPSPQAMWMSDRERSDTSTRGTSN